MKLAGFFAQFDQSAVDWGPVATIAAAVAGGLLLLHRQKLQWREARRDRIRDAYADWIGKVMVLHRKDEQVMEEQTYLQLALRAHIAAGQQVGPGGAIPIEPEHFRRVHAVRREQHAAQFEEDQAFSKITLLDSDQRRVLRAQKVKHLVPFVEVEPGQPPATEHFEKVQREKAEAIGWLAHDINRSLELEALVPWRWDGYERSKDERGKELHERLQLRRDGRRRE